MSRKKFLVFFVCLVLIGSLATACTQTRRPGTQVRDNNVPNQTRVTPNRVTPAPVAPRRIVPSPTPAPGNNVTVNQDYSKRVRDIARRAAELKEIDSASCVITGNTAIVGVQFDEQYKGGVTNEIKNKVDRACRDEDPQLRRVVVTADPDVVSRIQDMLKDIGKGKPVSGFTTEINELLNRIQPK